VDNFKVADFTGQVLDPVRAQEQAEGATMGEADVLISVYGIPDTGRPHGVKRKQVIDPGAFDDFMRTRDFEKNTVPFYLDHGWAHVTGHADSQLKLGFVPGFRSGDEGLVGAMRWNLGTQVGREAFSNAMFDPLGTKFSFRWTEDETYRASDGQEHVRRIPDIVEVSQLGIDGAQQGTYVYSDSIRMRTAQRVKELIEEDPEFSYLRELFEKMRQVEVAEPPAEVAEPPDESEEPPPEPPEEPAAESETLAAILTARVAELPAVLRSDVELRDAIRRAIEESERPDPVTEWYRDLWTSRR